MQNKLIKQASDLRGTRIERAIIIERAAIDQESRTVELAFATENPVERWYGFETLDCKPQSVRLERLLSGGPLLLGHDADDQIGVVESVTVGSDNICRASVRFSRAAEAEEIFQDVIDGIRRNVSVGYMVHEAVLEKEKEGVSYYRITDWEPFEVSLVPMPADTKCGVGRSIDQPTESETAPIPKKENHTMETVDTAAVERAAVEREQKRVADILAAGKDYASRGGIELAAEVSATPGATVETFRAKMLEKVTAEQAPSTTREPAPAQRITTDLRYNPQSLKAWSRHGNKAEEMAFRSGQWAKAVIGGDAAAERWCKDHNLDLRVMNTGSGAAGGFLVPDEMETGIIDLRAQFGVARRIAQMFPMSTGTLSIPKWSTGNTAYFAGEQVATTESDGAFGQVQLVAKELSALTRISMSLAEDAVIDLAAFLAEQQAYAFAVKEDACLIDGDGTATYGGMTGLKALLETANMAGIYTSASNSDTPAEIVASELANLMAVLPSYARNGARWLCSPAYEAAILGRIRAAAGGNTIQTLAGGIVEQNFLGYPATVAEPCYTATATDMTGKALLFFGNFQQGVAFGERRGITVQVLRERYAEYRQIGVLGSERIDINCHGVGTTSAVGPIVALIAG